MNFIQFQTHRQERIAAGYQDCGETNLYKSLPRSFPAMDFSFPPPEELTIAAYRCHLVEHMLDTLQLPREWKSGTLASHGVRSSLALIMAADPEKTWAIPSDVYPVYQTIATKAGVATKTYLQENTLDPADPGVQADRLLICHPAKPWDTEIDTNKIQEWLEAFPGRKVIIDSAYGLTPNSRITEMTQEGKAIQLYSLSKHWLIPGHFGVAIMGEEDSLLLTATFRSLTKNEENLKKAQYALTLVPNRPALITDMIRHLSYKMEEEIEPSVRDTVNFDSHGYFKKTRLTREELETEGIIAIPASVFGSKSHCSFISVL